MMTFNWLSFYQIVNCIHSRWHSIARLSFYRIVIKYFQDDIELVIILSDC